MGKLAVGLIVGLIGVSTACGGDDDDKLAVCTDSPYPPMEFQDEDDNFTGFDLELMREVGKRIDEEIEFKDLDFDALTNLQAIAAGDCDLIISSMTITEERADKGLFSDPYFEASQSLLIRAEDEQTYSDLESLAGQTIGVQRETTGATYAEENKPEGATVQSFTGTDEMFLALESGEVQGILQDLVVNRGRELEDDSTMVVGEFQTDEQYGIAAGKDDQELIDKVNDALKEIREDETYDELYKEWFDEEPPPAS